MTKSTIKCIYCRKEMFHQNYIRHLLSKHKTDSIDAIPKQDKDYLINNTLPLIVAYHTDRGRMLMNTVACMCCKDGSTIESKLKQKDFIAIHKDKTKYSQCHQYFESVKYLYETTIENKIIDNNDLLDDESKYILDIMKERNKVRKKEEDPEETLKESFDEMLDSINNHQATIEQIKINAKKASSKEIDELKTELAGRNQYISILEDKVRAICPAKQ